MARTEPIGWGFIGAGGVAYRRMLPAVHQLDEVRVAAVMVRDQARADAIAAEFGAAAAYDSVERLLADDGVEAVYVATPPQVHEEQVIAAAEAGKHILLEKPMALDLAACDRMLAATAAAGVALAVCFPLRHTGVVREMKRRISAGELGTLTYLRLQLAKWYPLDEAAWRADPVQSGGGVLMDLGSHLFDLAAYLGGPPGEVTALTARRGFDLAVEDTAVALLRLASGAVAVIETSFAAADSPNAIEVYGTEGALLAGSPRNEPRIRWLRRDGEEEISVTSPNVYEAEVVDFGRALRADRPAATSGLDGRVNVGCLTAAYQAARGPARPVATDERTTGG